MADFSRHSKFSKVSKAKRSESVNSQLSKQRASRYAFSLFRCSCSSSLVTSDMKSKSILPVHVTGSDTEMFLNVESTFLTRTDHKVFF